MSNMKFTGSIRGVRDGEMVLSNEPILTVTAPLIQGKILETPILNVLNYSDTYSDGNIENYTGSQRQGSPVFWNQKSVRL